MKLFSRVETYMRLIRPAHWLKNLFVVAPLFLAKKIIDPSLAGVSVGAFVLFSCAASAVYVWNDIIDRAKDREHEQKRKRPIASGEISVQSAAVFLAVLLAVTLLGAWYLGFSFFVVILAYFLLNVCYSLVLKHIVLIDIFAIAANYVLRIIGGTLVIGETISAWVIILGSLLALFLAIGKRRSEQIVLQENAVAHRATFGEYNAYLLDQLAAVVTPSIIMAWTMYTLDTRVENRLHTAWMPITIPFVLYGIFRYLYLVHQRGKGESPTHTLLSDLPLLLTVGLWALTILFLRIYTI